jgi:hypothetical protein
VIVLTFSKGCHSPGTAYRPDALPWKQTAGFERKGSSFTRQPPLPGSQTTPREKKCSFKTFPFSSSQRRMYLTAAPFLHLGTAMANLLKGKRNSYQIDTMNSPE